MNNKVYDLDSSGWSLTFDSEGLSDEMASRHRDVVFDFIKENLHEIQRRIVASDDKAKPEEYKYVGE